jgi:hypothetical protein
VTSFPTTWVLKHTFCTTMYWCKFVHHAFILYGLTTTTHKTPPNTMMAHLIHFFPAPTLSVAVPLFFPARLRPTSQSAQHADGGRHDAPLPQTLSSQHSSALSLRPSAQQRLAASAPNPYLRLSGTWLFRPPAPIPDA